MKCRALFTLSGDEYEIEPGPFLNDKNRFYNAIQSEAAAIRAGKPAALGVRSGLQAARAVIQGELKSFADTIQGSPELEIIIGDASEYANPLRCKNEEEFYGWVNTLKSQFGATERHRIDTSTGSRPEVSGDITTSVRVQTTGEPATSIAVQKSKRVRRLDLPGASLGVRLSLADELEMKGDKADEFVRKAKDANRSFVRDKTTFVIPVPVSAGATGVVPEIHMSKVVNGDKVIFEAEVELPLSAERNMKTVPAACIDALLTVAYHLLQVITVP